MTRARRVQAFPVLWLAAVWVLLWGNLSWANVLGGLALGLFITVVFPLPRVVAGVRVRPLKASAVVLRFLRDVLVASFQVSWLALRPQPLPASSLVVVHLHGRAELFQTIVAEMTALVPGSVVIDLDPESGRLALHVLAADTPEKVEGMRQRTLDLERRVVAALAADPEDVGRRDSGFETRDTDDSSDGSSGGAGVEDVDAGVEAREGM
ncbi:Na+/H+ antiporter subunit E [Thalassiella azotivora]